MLLNRLRKRGSAEGGYEEGEVKEAFPDSCDWRGFAARTHYVPAAAPFDERSRPRRSPCPRLPFCTFAPVAPCPRPANTGLGVVQAV